MNKKEALSLIRTLRSAGILKRTKRAGWLEKVGICHPESVADHSYRVAFTASLLGDMLGLDTCKMVKMALIHDLAEAVTGDMTPDNPRGKNKKLEENRAIGEILSVLPPKIRVTYQGLWNEWVTGKTREASILHELDSFEMALQAREYEESGCDAERLQEFKKSAANRAHDPSVKKLVEICLH